MFGLAIYSWEEFTQHLQKQIKRGIFDKFLKRSEVLKKVIEEIWKNPDCCDYDCLEVEEWEVLSQIFSSKEYETLKRKCPFIDVWSYRLPRKELNIVFYMIGNQAEDLCFAYGFADETEIGSEAYEFCKFIEIEEGD